MDEAVKLILWVVGGGIFVLCFGTAVILWTVAARKRERCSEETVATVVEVDMFLRRYMFRYVVNGETIDRRVYLRNDFDRYFVGKPVNILVNPYDLREIILLNIFGGRSTQFVGGVLAFVGVLNFSIFALVCVLL